MNYRCPQCRRALSPRGLFFHDISTCSGCGQKVVLGDFLAFSMAALSMAVAALSSLYILGYEFDQYFVAAGYAVSIGMVSGLVVLFLLGRAAPFRRLRVRRSAPVESPQPAGKN
jgi:uncharacterized membrane protein